MYNCSNSSRHTNTNKNSSSSSTQLKNHKILSSILDSALLTNKNKNTNTNNNKVSKTNSFTSSSSSSKDHGSRATVVANSKERRTSIIPTDTTSWASFDPTNTTTTESSSFTSSEITIMTESEIELNNEYNNNDSNKKNNNKTLNDDDNNNNNISKKDVIHRMQHVLNPSAAIIGNKSISSGINSILSSKTDSIFVMTSLYTFLAWIVLVVMVYACTDQTEWVYLPIEERRTCQLAIIIHIIAFFLQVMRMGLSTFSFQNRKSISTYDGTTTTSTKSQLGFFTIKPGSGILIAGFVVQLISFLTDVLLAFAPTVVKIDPVTHSRVFLLRWAEWIPTAGAMTFLSEGLDIHLNDNNNNSNNNDSKNNKKENDNEKNMNDPIALRTVVLWSLTQSVSCIAGMLFPYAPNLFVWNIIMFWSVLLYFAIFPRVLVRRKLYYDLLRRHKENIESQSTPASLFVGSTNNNKELSSSAAIQVPPFTFNASNLLLIEQENVQLRRFSYYLIFTCAGVWTVLVALYFVNFALHISNPAITGTTSCTTTQRGYYVSETELEALAMIIDTLFDVVAKVIYIRLIVGVYLDVFDLSGRVQRQLHELHRLVSAIWESSSDVISISVRIHPYNLNRVVAMFSPSFTTLVEAGDITFKSEHKTKMMPSAALMLELDIPPGKPCSDDMVPHYTIVSAYYVDSTSIAVPNLPNSNEKFFVIDDLNNNAVVEAARIVAQSWDSILDAPSGDSVDEILRVELDDGVDVHRKEDIVDVDNNMKEIPQFEKSHSQWLLLDHLVVNSTGREHICEMKVSRHAENAVVAVVRDVTERDRRFEAERRAHSETLARQRDAQAANRFTRHEVKNGLLAGIELCDTLRKTVSTIQQDLIKELQQTANDALKKHMRQQQQQQADDKATKDEQESSSIYGDGVLPIISEDVVNDRLTQVIQHGLSNKIAELDKTLQDVLETTLTEAMSREVVHEVYVPRLERVSIPTWFEGTDTCGKKERFPVHIVDRNTFPELLTDIQLLNYIRRNAVSNACKYGKTGGIVATRVWYNHVNQVLHLEVSNEPGVDHQELLDMGDAASEAVFQQGVRLQTKSKASRGSGIEDSRASSGDGAWIMQKCAMTLGGVCSIQFLVNETLFSFACPAAPATLDQPNLQEFRVPPTTWGIAVDDSSIQRKLMDRILANFGIEETRRFILGEKPSDIEELRLLIKKILARSTDDKILILMDENLDYNEADSIPVLISGSNAMNDLLRSLEPQEELRLLAIIRSANDSAEEIAFYSERSHGFFPKATMQRDRVREILYPLWKQRFGSKSI